MENFAFAAPISVAISGFNGGSVVTSRVAFSRSGTSRRATIHMISEAVIAKKSAIVESVKERLAVSEMVFAVPLDGLTVANVYQLRQQLPEGTSAVSIKNSLMRRAIAESKWEAMGDFLQQSNLWFFVQEDIKQSVDVYTKFAKTAKREGIKGGGFEGERCDAAGIQAIAALPSKQELIRKIAVSLKIVPTKLGSSVKAVPTKVAKAIKLAIADEEEGSDAASE
ncbi:50S ribosomal protein L10 [Gracilariopsis chorda]|uniref:50S ribosomal protein L10 n=1 Tax=Gracilariopsis chorda TaxID=448386 RepID=A0A2V3J4A9_9FLOR|nr:50S ribosomal protein L10 [Gracilariopsis chorda]|eukprot:PXF48210.1 50S ribosomal protein L10 [Gracilariopsis chorda]